MDSWRDFDPDAPRSLFPATGERVENPLRAKPATVKFCPHVHESGATCTQVPGHKGLCVGVLRGSGPGQDRFFKWAPEKPKALDRGQLRGAKWVIVDGLTMYDYALAKANGIEGILFKSRKEAKRWISLLQLERAGGIRNLRRQVRFPLETIRRQDGLIAIVAHYVADFVYDEPNGDTWIGIVEDAKPSGMMMKHGKRVPFREEIYALKKRWFEAAYGVTIRET